MRYTALKDRHIYRKKVEVTFLEIKIEKFETEGTRNNTEHERMRKEREGNAKETRKEHDR